MIRVVALAVLLGMAGSSLADEPIPGGADSRDDGFVKCALAQATVMAAGPEVADIAADKAIGQCNSEFSALRSRLRQQISSRGASTDTQALDAEAEETANFLRMQLRNQIIGVIMYTRASK